MKTLPHRAPRAPRRALVPLAAPAAALALALLSLLPARPAAAQRGELTIGERAAVLYSTQFTFDKDNVPEISIAIMDQQDEVRFSLKGSLRILPTGAGGPEILADGGRAWIARVEDGAPAKVRYRVVLEQLPARDLPALRAARARYEKLGLAIKAIEVGSVFSFFGQVMDSRQVLLAIDQPYDDQAPAQTAADDATERFGQDCTVHAQLDERSSGTVVLTDERGTVTVRARDAIWLAPANPAEPFLVRQVEYGRGMPWHGRQDRGFRGRMYLAVDRTGRLAAVNLVDGETVLRGVVPTEIFPTSPMDALKAQAVVARGELLAKIGTRHLADPYLLCSDVHCQAYSGTLKETERTDEAVRATRGEILFDGEGLVDSVYSASCGGHSEHNEHVWGSSPRASLRGGYDGPTRPSWLPEGELQDDAVKKFLTTPVDAWCGRASKGADSFRWKKAVAAWELTPLVAQRYPEVGDVEALTVLSRGVSGRVRALEIRGAKGTVTVERELPIRRLFGGLKSGLFVVETDLDGRGKPVRFRFTGGGFGHGVGMCQVGAIGMAEAGRSYVDILTHYYRDAAPKKIY
jgi:SpoIID/LytB domain protein